jgi:dolichol-phosphate mannosyltransferase
MGAMEAIVVIATYNEATSIGQILDYLPYAAIVVDDNSPDGTAKIAERWFAVVINRLQKGGVASAYRDGFKEALEFQPRFIVQMDAGFTHNPADVERLIDKAKAGNRLVIGSRFLNNVPNNPRSVISKAAAFLMRWLGVNVADATSGFRCWDIDLLAEVIKEPFKATHFAFQLETLYRADRIGATIGEIPIEYKLTNSSFKPAMLVEALKIYIGLWRDRLG